MTSADDGNQEKMGGDKKMKAVELARAVGVSEATISRIIRGRRRPSWHVAKKIAAATSTNVELWMDGETDERRASLDAAENGRK